MGLEKTHMCHGGKNVLIVGHGRVFVGSPCNGRPSLWQVQLPSDTFLSRKNESRDQRLYQSRKQRGMAKKRVSQSPLHAEQPGRRACSSDRSCKPKNLAPGPILVSLLKPSANNELN